MKNHKLGLLALVGLVLGITFAATLTLQAQTATRPTITASSVEGVVTWVTPTEIQVKTSAANDPVHVSYNRSTAYMDENGRPLGPDSVAQGQQVMVCCERQGDAMVASRVVVKKVVGANPGGSPGRHKVNSVP